MGLNSGVLESAGTEQREAVVTVAGGAIPIRIGRGAARDVKSWWPERWRRALLVTQEGVPIPFDIPDGVAVSYVEKSEGAKFLATIERLASDAIRAGLTRNDGVIAVGGGVVTDVAGFFASVYYRGIELVNIPTSLLGMVDAAIGGKTGVNLAEGKNLLGSFWQPLAVICDLDTLASLPPREWRSGAGEMAKYIFLGAGDLLSHPFDLQVYGCARIKAEVVSADERESGTRALLNYGHTLGHAIEGAFLARGEESAISHGEAVAVGMIFASRLARSLGRISAERVEEHLRVLSAFHLSPFFPPELEPEEMLGYLKVDKKNQAGLTFVLDGSAGLEVVAGIEETVVLREIEEFARWSG